MPTEERNNISKEIMLLLVIRAERYFFVIKADKYSDVKSAFQILSKDFSNPIGHNQSLLRYIAGDPSDSFEMILN